MVAGWWSGSAVASLRFFPTGVFFLQPILPGFNALRVDVVSFSFSFLPLSFTWLTYSATYSHFLLGQTLCFGGWESVNGPFTFWFHLSLWLLYMFIWVDFRSLSRR